MKLTLEAQKIELRLGDPFYPDARVWKGVTEDGVPVVAVIASLDARSRRPSGAGGCDPGAADRSDRARPRRRERTRRRTGRVRPAYAYRAARRAMARQTLRAFRRNGARTDWRRVWEASREAYASASRSRRSPRAPKPGDAA